MNDVSLINRAIGLFVKQINKITYLFSNNSDIAIKPIKELFYNFCITKALHSLDEAIQNTNEKDISTRYLLYLLKAEFSFMLSKIDDFKNIIKFLEKNYNKAIDANSLPFKRWKLTYLCLESNEKDYLNLAEAVAISQNREIEYYRLIYYINHQNTAKIQDILKNGYKINEVSTEFANVLGIAYTILCRKKIDIDIHHKLMLDFYKKYEESDTCKKLNLLNICLNKCFMANILFNKQEKIDLIYLSLAEDAMNIVESVLDEMHNFEQGYRKEVINNLAILYMMLNEKDKFISLFKEYSGIMNEFCHIQYYLSLNNPISFEKVYELYKEKNFLNLLGIYLEELFIKREGHKVIQYVEDNGLLSLNNEQIENLYFISKVSLRQNIKEIYEKYVSKKNEDLLTAIIYLKTSKELKLDISMDFLERIKETLSTTENLHDYFVKSLVKILFKIDSKYTFSLVLKVSPLYPYLIAETMLLSSKIINVNLYDFQNFTEQIDEKLILDKFSYYANIGTVYGSFFHYYKTYKYYLLAWQEKNDIGIGKAILDLIVRMKNINIVLEDKEVFADIYAFLQYHKAFTKVETALLGTYYHFQNKEWSDGIKYYNKSLLEANIDELNITSFDMIGSLYFKSIMDVENESLFDISENLLITESPLFNMIFTKDKDQLNAIYIKPFNQIQWLNHNSKIYINSIYKNLEIKTLFDKHVIYFLSSKDYLTLSKYVKNQSLFHYISNKLIYRANNVHPVTIGANPDNQFEEIFELVKKSAERNKEIFDNYNSGKFVSFYFLSKACYENYPPLMFRELLEKQENIFDAGKNICIKDAKKLLSISSLLFLKYLGYLDKVLALENIYVQETVLNWVELTKNSLKYDKTKMSMSYENGNFYKHERTEKEKEGLIQVYEELYELLINISYKERRIIKDYEFTLPYKLSVDVIMKIGHLDIYAMSYVIINEYQLITEDISISKFLSILNAKVFPISNSMSLLMEVLEQKEFINKAYDLHKRQYSETISPTGVRVLENFILSENSKVPLELENLYGKLMVICDESGYLEKIKIRASQDFMIQDTTQRIFYFEKFAYLRDLQGIVQLDEALKLLENI